MAELLVYLNGRLVPTSAAHLALYDIGFVQGATLTEQTRTFHRRPWRLEQHLDRLFRGLEYMGLDIGMSREQLAEVSVQLVEHNARLLEEADELGLVHFVTPGEHSVYAGGLVRTAPTVCAHTFPLPFALWARKMREGQHLITPSVRHVPPECWDPTVKCRSRMNYYLADREARRIDPEAVALLLDLDGNVTETNAANLLLVRGGTVMSPTTRHTLPGISRAMVIELCSKLGVPFLERDLQVADVLQADEALLSSTPFCLMPATKLNGQAIGDGRPGPMFRRLLTAWSEVVGLDIEKQIHDGARRRAG